MNAQAVDAGRALAWYTGGWRLFMVNPGLWVLMALGVLVIGFALLVVPLLGPLAMSLVTPALIGGMMLAAREAALGRPIDLAQLLCGLTDPDKRNAMLVLGALLIVLSLALAIVSAIILGGSAGIGLLLGGLGGEGEAAAGAVGVGLLMTLALVLIYNLAAFGLMAYSIPLVMFTEAQPSDAIKASIRAAIENIVPVAVFVAIYFVLAMIATIPFGLGFLVLIPVAVCAVYTSYAELFPAGAPRLLR